MLKKVDIIKVDVIAPNGTKTYFIDRSSFILGRQEGCDIKVDDPNISREHFKVSFSEEQGVTLEDLGSSNGTFLGVQRIPALVHVPVTEKDVISFAKSDIRIKVSLVKMNKQTKLDANKLVLQAKESPVQVEMTGYEKDENELRLNFKNIGLDTAKYLTPAEQAQGIIQEAEFLSQSLLKAASAQQQKILNETRLAAKKISDETYEKYRKKVDQLLKETQSTVNELKAKNETFIQERKKEAFDEITHQWGVHEKAIEDSESKLLKKIEADNALKFELEIEKIKLDQAIVNENLLKNTDIEIQNKIDQQRKILAEELLEHQKNMNILLDHTKNEMQRMREEAKKFLDSKRRSIDGEIQEMWNENYIKLYNERQQMILKLENDHKIKFESEYERMKTDILIMQEKTLLEAQQDIESQKIKFKHQCDLEQSEHEDHLRAILNQKNHEEKEYSILLEKNADLKDQKISLELDLDQLNSKVITTTESLQLSEARYKELSLECERMQAQLTDFSKTKNEVVEQELQAKNSLEALKQKFSQLLEQRNSAQTQLTQLEEQLSVARQKNKLEVEAEYKAIKNQEEQKFEQFKAQQLQELKKVRDEHSESVKKISLDLSQEIATRIELLNKKTNGQNFDYNKNVEVINSIIQIKTGTTAVKDSRQQEQHQVQIENWKKRNSSEKRKNIALGFAAAFICYFAGSMIYNRMTQNSYEIEMRQLASERQSKERENQFLPTKADQYYDDYVRATIYTENFSETYLDDKVHQEWVKKVTYYFLNKWKVSEETTIRVTSNSRALVEAIQFGMAELKKDRLKQGLEKLNALERENVQEQVKLLGTNVRYEAYKKLEKEFFTEKLQQRGLATERK